MLLCRCPPLPEFVGMGISDATEQGARLSISKLPADADGYRSILARYASTAASLTSLG